MDGSSPLGPLGRQTSIRQDLEWSPAELVYGASLRLPGEFLFPPEDPVGLPSTDFVTRLRSALAAMRPAPSVHHRRPLSSAVPGVPLPLVDVSHVFVRVDAVKKPLSRPYEGPFRVLERTSKTFVISRAGKAWTVSVNRLKPARGFVDAVAGPVAPLVPPAGALAAVSAGAVPRSPACSPSSAPLTTRSGRVSRPQSRL